MALAPGGKLDVLVQAIGAMFGHNRVAPPEFTTATDWKVELFGVASLKVGAAQLLGPRFVTIWV